jgi:4'-phosphopantetheinyl transferase
MRSALPMADIQRHIDDGGIAVLWAATGTGVEGARKTARALSAYLVARLGADALHVSRSATCGLAGVAVARGVSIGLDAERLRPDRVDDSMKDTALHPSERARGCTTRDFYDLWVRKEAALKALGVGLAIAPGSFAINPASQDWLPFNPDGSCVVRVRSLWAPTGFRAAVATLGKGGYVHPYHGS